MIRCKKCNLAVEAGNPRCPLCFAALENSGDSAVRYPNYNAAYRENRPFTLGKLFLFLSIALSMLCVTINLLTWVASGYLWSLIVIALLVIAWSLYLTLRSRRVNTAGRILLLYLLAAAIVLAIDDPWEGALRWSTTYVLPLLTIPVVLALTVLAVRGRQKYKDYLGYLIAALLISICPLFLYLFSLSDAIWPSIAALLYSLLTVIGLYLFSDSAFKIEMKKRFHF